MATLAWPAPADTRTRAVLALAAVVFPLVGWWVERRREIA